MKNLLKTVTSKYSRRKNRGAAAIEFALIAPILVMILFSASELTFAVNLKRKTSIASSTIADLVTQYDTIDCATLGSLVAMTRIVYEPFDGGPASINIASVGLDVGGNPVVEWSRIVNSNGTCSDSPAYPVGSILNIAGTDGAGDPINLAIDMIPAGGSIIVGKVTIPYNSVGTSFLPNTITMSDNFFLRPRISSRVCFTGIASPGC